MLIYTCYYNYYKIPRTKHTRTLNSYIQASTYKYLNKLTTYT